MRIRKATLTLVDKFFSLLVRDRVSWTQADNIITYDKKIVVETMVAGLETYFAKFILAVIHKREYKTSITHPFPCLLF